MQTSNLQKSVCQKGIINIIYRATESRLNDIGLKMFYWTELIAEGC